MNGVIILNDGTFIGDEASLCDYLINLGFNVDDLRNELCSDIVEERDIALQDNQYYELLADDYHNKLNGLSTEIEDLADKLATGKGGTKVQYSQRFKYLADYYNQ